MKSIFFWIGLLVQVSVLAKRSGDVIPGQYIIKVAPGFSLEEVLQDHGIRPRYKYSATFRGFADQISEDLRQDLAGDSRVLKVVPDRVVSIHSAQPGATWGIDRIDQRTLPLDRVFNYNFTGSQVTAYIIDSGIKYEHSEFSGRATFGFDVYGGNGSDCNGHGTHVAGTVGGMISGIAKGVNLVSVRVVDCFGFGSVSGLLAGMEWVRINHRPPAVANVSLGLYNSSELDEGVLQLIDAGVTTVVAAGNNPTMSACDVSPARVPEAITVGASNAKDQKAIFSSWGRCVDWFAPGVDIYSADIKNLSGTVYNSGTSMAAPHTTGAAAIYLQHYPMATPQMVRDALFQMSTKSVVTEAQTPNNHLLYFNEADLVVPGPIKPVVLKGYFEGAADGSLSGWTCAQNTSAPAAVHFYVDAPAGQGGLFLGGLVATAFSEEEVEVVCGTVSKAHRFNYRYDRVTQAQFCGREIFAHSIAPVGKLGDTLLLNRYQFTDGKEHFKIPCPPN